MKTSLILLALCLFAHCLSAQCDTSQSKSLAFSAYLETYYAYDFSRPAQHQRPSFAYSFNRHNEFNLNLGFVKVAYQQERLRANLALMAGTYANANLANEPGVLKNILEANIGIKLSKKSNTWLDLGILPSHIGFESAIGADCWNLTRSILADNSPYFESGLRLSHSSANDKWYFSVLLLNGWQRIQRLSGNSLPSFGHQITWKPQENLSLNSSSFIGTDQPDSSRTLRYFHNFYALYQINKHLGLTLGFDLGAEQKAKGSTHYHLWYSPVLIAQYQFNPTWALAARAEYYADPNQVVVQLGDQHGFKTWSYSLNLDYTLWKIAKWRIEARTFQSQDPIFEGNRRQNFLLTSSLSIRF